jgi:hypothetical protein
MSMAFRIHKLYYKDRGLEFHKGLLELIAFVDASFGDDPETKKTTVGHIIFLGTSQLAGHHS